MYAIMGHDRFADYTQVICVSHDESKLQSMIDSFYEQTKDRKNLTLEVKFGEFTLKKKFARK